MADIKLIVSIVGTLLTIYLVTPLVSPLWKQLVFVLFALYTLPLLNLRKEFRSMVYDDASWKINIKPVFFREFKVLFSNNELENEHEVRVANKYRVYLFGYSILLLLLTVV